MKNILKIGLIGVSLALGSAAQAGTIGFTEGVRALVAGTTAVASTDSSADPALAFDVGTVGVDTIEVYGRIVDSVDNFAFSFTATSSFSVSFIFGGYTLDAGGFVADSGFVSEVADEEKAARFRLLDADDSFAVLDTEVFTTDVTSGAAGIFSGAAGNYVLQIDGSGPFARGPGVGLYDVRLAAVPLPASALLLMGGVAVFGAIGRRRS